MASYLPYEPQQQMLLPEALQDWLPEGHLACFISDAVDGLDLSAFHARYNSGGPRNQPFHPAMMVKVLVYAYASGVFSSRKIAALLNKGKSADEAEKNEPELDKQRQREADIKRGRSDDDDRKPRGKDGKPKGGRYKREFGKPEDSAQENFTDPDSRIMKRAGGGYDASYNAQTAVDEAAHIIVAAELTNNASDAGELPTMLHAVRNNLGQMPQHRSPRTAQMAAKLQTDEGKAAYRRRKWIAEPPNGWVKSALGFRQFSMRGLHRVQAEWKLSCAWR